MYLNGGKKLENLAMVLAKRNGEQLMGEATGTIEELAENINHQISNPLKTIRTMKPNEHPIC